MISSMICSCGLLRASRLTRSGKFANEQVISHVAGDVRSSTGICCKVVSTAISEGGTGHEAITVNFSLWGFLKYVWKKPIVIPVKKTLKPADPVEWLI